MFLSKMYQIWGQVVEQFELEVRNQRVLLDMVAATVASRSCQLEDLARSLQPRGTLDAQYRRVQRFLANERVDVAVVQREWARFVVESMKTDEVRLVVDITGPE